jgi:NADPH:quinone reductase-like Zn-dependent oxidoreductase
LQKLLTTIALFLLSAPLLKASGKRLPINTLTNGKVAYLNLLFKMLSEGKLKIKIDRIYPFEQIVAAHNYVDFGHKKGNIKLRH